MRVSVKAPATSANLGPGFDTLAIALELYLRVEAETASDFSVRATGRDAEMCGAERNNLLIETYRATLERQGRPAQPLSLTVHNEIPLGMGCGSSAAARVAGIALASEFGGLHWSRERMLREAAMLEKHPDNAAACCLGGFTTSAMSGDTVQAITLPTPARWEALVVLPPAPLRTEESRALLPATYDRDDVIFNLQRVALLTSAFAAGRPEILREAMRDRVHQPYRLQACPLLERLAPIVELPGVLGMALSGAGPAVLVVLESSTQAQEINSGIRERGETGVLEIIPCRFDQDGLGMERLALR